MAKKELPPVLSKRLKKLESQNKEPVHGEFDLTDVQADIEQELKDKLKKSKLRKSDKEDIQSLVSEALEDYAKKHPYYDIAGGASEKEDISKLVKNRTPDLSVKGGSYDIARGTSEKEDPASLAREIKKERGSRIKDTSYDAADITRLAREIEEEKDTPEIDESAFESVTSAGEIDVPDEIFEPNKEKPIPFEAKVHTKYERPFSDLEEKFFKEGELMDRGAYVKGEVITEHDRADAYGKALEAMKPKDLARFRYFSEMTSLKKVARDIELRHKMAPNEFPHSAKEIITMFNKVKWMETEINNMTERMNALLKKAGERKKKKGLLGRLFTTKKGMLEPEELQEYKFLDLDYKASIKHYKETYNEYQQAFKPLRDLAERGNGATIAPRQLTHFSSFPKIGAAAVS